MDKAFANVTRSDTYSLRPGLRAILQNSGKWAQMEEFSVSRGPRFSPRICCIAVAVAFVMITADADAQNLGSAPSSAVDVTPVYTAFKLPPLKDTAAGGLVSVLSTTQVGMRAKMLGLTGQSGVDAWSGVENVLGSRVSSAPAAAVEFSGRTASELNALLSSGATAVAVTSSTLSVDQPILLQRDGVTLDLRRAVLTSNGTQPYMLRVAHSRSARVVGGQLAGGNSGVLVEGCDGTQVDGLEIRNLRGFGIVVTGSKNVEVTRNRISGVAEAGIFIHGGTTASAISENVLRSNLGHSNITAGIVVSDREVNVAADPQAIFGPDGYWVVSQPITGRLNPPHDNVIAFNDVRLNASSGIYVDGGVRNVIVSNVIDGNSKEGLCLDNGSTANVVASNVVQHNGNRWGEPDWVLARDYVLNYGRLADGTAAAKVPGISIDNAMYNIVFSNSVSHNFGGGIKMVRTGYFNVLGVNTIFSNNDGASSTFHFFGIELGAATGDSSSGELDFTPSRGNIVFSNAIRGSHYSGIFFAGGSDQNDVFDNVIMDSQAWALESVAVMANHTLNNLTNLPSRNVGSGLDPVLLQLGQPRVDGTY